MKYIFILSLLFLAQFNLFSQNHTQIEMARDTIVDIKFGLGTRYYLDNKVINIPVMTWFMQEYKGPTRNIFVASVLSNSGSIYITMGGISVALGATVRAKDKEFSNALYIFGGGTTGLGFALYYMGEVFKRKAVKQYNQLIKNKYSNNFSLEMSSSKDGIGLKFVF